MYCTLYTSYNTFLRSEISNQYCVSVLLIFPSFYTLGIGVTMAAKPYKTHVISGFRRDVDEICALLGCYYPAYLDSWRRYR